MKLLILSGILLISFNNAHAQDDEYAYDDYYDSLIVKSERKAPEDGRKVLETGRVMTLTNKEILPGSCWDYANAVYDRAGYSWGKRENVFKSVKSGPYADVRKIRNGDWLYYVNHSYGDIEHSAIFVDWIDIDNKLALMLSYGGEKRHEPARYIIYELSSVYEITRANSNLSSSKTTEKNSLITTNSVTENKSVSSNNASNSTATTSVSGGVVNGVKIESLKFGTGVTGMEVAGEGVNFSGAADKVYCWMRVTGGQGKTLKVKWYYNGNVFGETPLDIRSNSMRTYAYRTITGKKGNWKVEITDDSGALLHAAGFAVN